MAMHTFQIHPAPLKHQHFPLPPLHKLSPNTRRPSFSFLPKTATITRPPGTGVVVNCLPPLHHADEDPELIMGLREEPMPSHVAVIMDGNRRWARMRGLPTGLGYEAGARAFTRVVDLCCKWRIKVLTLFVFSCDNWISRPKPETDLVMVLFEKRLRNDLPHFIRQKVHISHIGDSTKLPKSLQELLIEAVETTKKNSTSPHSCD